VPEPGLWSSLDVGGSGVARRLSVSGRTNRANLLKRELTLPGGGGRGTLHTDQVNECPVAGIRGKLTSHARFLVPPTFPGASEDPDPNNVPSIPTTRP